MPKATPYVELPTPSDIDSDRWEGVANFAIAETLTQRMAVQRIFEKTEKVMQKHGIQSHTDIPENLQEEIFEGFQNQDDMVSEDLSPLLHWMLGYIHNQEMQNPMMVALSQMNPAALQHRYNEFLIYFLFGMSAGWAWHHLKENE